MLGLLFGRPLDRWLVFAFLVSLLPFSLSNRAIHLCTNITTTTTGNLHLQLADLGQIRQTTCACSVTNAPDTHQEFSLFSNFLLGAPQSLSLSLDKEGPSGGSGFISKQTLNPGSTLGWESVFSMNLTFTNDGTVMTSATFLILPDSNLRVKCASSGWIPERKIKVTDIVAPLPDKLQSDDDLPVVIVLAVIIGVLLILAIVFFISCYKFRKLSKELQALQSGNSPNLKSIQQSLSSSPNGHLQSWMTDSPTYHQSFEPLPDVFPPQHSQRTPPAVPSRPPATLGDHQPRRSSGDQQLPNLPGLQPTPETQKGRRSSSQLLSPSFKNGQNLLPKSLGRAPSIPEEGNYYASLEGSYIPID